jgi:hypothetical protein
MIETDAQPLPQNELASLINAYQVSQAIYVVTALEIPDLLDGTSRHIDNLADVTETQPAALYRVLRALATIGIFIEEEGKWFALTPLGAGLRKTAPQSCAAWVRFSLAPTQWAAWGEMLCSVRAGENGFRRAHGQDVWSYRTQHPKDRALFDLAMRERASQLAGELLMRDAFGPFKHILDVGGGDGTLLAAVLLASPSKTATLLELPHVAVHAGAMLQHAGLSDRCSVVGGSFFDAVPRGGDCYLLKNILHDWDDAEALIILRNCRAAMAEGAKLLIIERLLAPANKGPEAKFADLNMLVITGGRERTKDEFTSLLQQAGFALGETLPLAGAAHLIGALPE